MSRLILLFVSLAVIAQAGTNYLAVCIREDIKHPEKVMGKLALKDYFEDITEVQMADLPEYYNLTPESNNWKVVCFPIAVGTVHKNKHKTNIVEWVLQNFPNSETDKIDVVSCGLSPRADLEAAGYIKPEKELP